MLSSSIKLFGILLFSTIYAVINTPEYFTIQLEYTATTVHLCTSCTGKLILPLTVNYHKELWIQVYLVGRPEVFLQSGHLVVEGKIRHEAESLWHCGLGMLDARQHVEGVHIVHKLHTKLVFGRHLR